MKNLLFAIAALLLSYVAQSQIVTPHPRPLSKVEQRIGISDVTLTYSRPGVKGRKIFGDHLSWGEIWRFGANSPTKVKFSDSTKVGNTWVAPGEYAIYATPVQSGDWTIYFGKDTKVQAGDFKTEEAVVKYVAKAETLPMNVETFTLGFTDITNTTANLTMMWEKTSIKIPLKVEVDSKVMASIKKTIGDVQPYYSAASYMYEADKDLGTALIYVDKVLEKRPEYWILHLKAKILKKLGKCKEAIPVAEASIVKAKTENDKAYIKNNEELIAACKAGK